MDRERTVVPQLEICEVCNTRIAALTTSEAGVGNTKISPRPAAYLTNSGKARNSVRNPGTLERATSAIETPWGFPGGN